jgi:hypothetical protein
LVFFEWSWLTESLLARYICARDHPNFGELKSFSMSKFTKAELVQPKPTVGEHSEVLQNGQCQYIKLQVSFIFLVAFQFNRLNLLYDFI